MEVSNWFAQNWFDLFQAVCIIATLLFTAYTIREDVRGRRIANAIAIKEQHQNIWDDFYTRPSLSRVLAKAVDLKGKPVSDEEEWFVAKLISHLSSVYRATVYGEFVKLEGLKMDVQDFFGLPIPKGVWEKMKRFQDQDFVEFLETSLVKGVGAAIHGTNAGTSRQRAKPVSAARRNSDNPLG